MIPPRAGRLMAALAAGILLPAVSCTAFRPGPPSFPPGPPPAGRTFLARLSAPGFSRMRGIYRGTVRHAGRRRSFRQVWAMEPPDRGRVDLLGPMGHPRLVLAFSEQGTVGILPRDRVYFREAVQQRAFLALLGVPLAARDLLPLVTGEVLYREEGTVIGSAEPAREGWWLKALQPGAGLQYRILLDGRTGEIREVHLERGDGGGERILSVRYGRGAGGKSPRVPHRIELRVPGTGFQMVSVLQKADFDGKEFPDGLFSPAIPSGFRRVAVEELARDHPLFAGP